MALSILTGSFTALERALLERLAKDPPGPSRRLAIVTASAHLRDSLQHFLAVESNLSLLNLRFHTFYSLARETAGGPAPLINDQVFQERLIRRVLIDKGAAPGAAEVLAGAYLVTLRDLEEGGVDPDQLKEHFTELEVPGGREAAFWRLLDVYKAYRRALDERGAETPARLARRAAQKVESGAAPAYAEIYYYGAYDLNGAQSDFFAALARHANVTAFFPLRLGHPADKFAERFYEVKLHVGGAAAQALPEDPFTGAVAAAGEALFVPGAAGQAVPPENLILMNASGARDEAWRVAKEIRRLVDEEGVGFEDIGVVARDLGLYEGFLPRLFEENAIPLAEIPAVALMAHPYAQSAMALLASAIEDLALDDLLELLDSPFLRGGAWTAATLDEARLFLERWGTGAGRERLAALVETAAATGAPDGDNDRVDAGEAMPWLSAEAGRALAAFLRMIRLDLMALPERSWRAWSAATASLLAERLDAPEDDPAGPAARRVVEVMESLKLLDNLGPPASPADFMDALRRAFRGAEGPAGETRRGVRWLGAMDARGESFRVLFLMGAKEGAFPRVIREDPLLPDRLRRLLQDPAGYWILPKRDGYDEERMLFSLLVRSAREKLYVSYPRTRDDGRAEVPSLYLRELCRAARRPYGPDESVARPPLERWAGAPARDRTLTEATALAVAGGRSPEDLETALRRGGMLAEPLRRLAALQSYGAPTAWDGLAGPPEKFLAKVRERGFSPTALDDFATCPFQFFARRVLRLPDDRPMEARVLPPWLKGRIYHLVLERFGKAMIIDGNWGDETRAKLLLDRAFREVFSDQGPLARAFPPILWRVLRDDLRQNLGRVVGREMAEARATGYQPEMVEEPLRGRAGFGPEGLDWHGTPDRVEKNALGHRRVVDYKSTAQEKSMEDRAIAGIIHQPFAYLDLVGEKAAEVVYHYIEEKEPWAESLSAEAARAHWSVFKQKADRDYAEIAAGRFPIRPKDGAFGHCARCPYMWTCRKSHGPTRRRSEMLAPGGDE